MQIETVDPVYEILRAYDAPPNGTTAEIPTKPINASTFNILSIPSIWSLGDETITYVVDDLVPEGGITLITGDSGVGKSTLVLQIAGAVATGIPFAGYGVRQRKVLYVDRENPLNVVRERLNRLGIEETQELVVWGLWNNPGPDGPASKSIIEFAREHRPLIIFDSLIAFHSGSEQDASETRRHLQHYRALASAGATVIILHHTGKADSAQEYRGSSDIKAAVDCAYVLQSTSEAGSGIQSARLVPFKNRFSVGQPLRLDYSSGRFQVGVDNTPTNRETVERIMQENSDASKTDLLKLAQDAGVRRKRAEEIVETVVKEGLYVPCKAGRGRTTFRRAEMEVGIL